MKSLSKRLAVLLLCVCAALLICKIPSEAGSSDLIVDKTSFAEELDTSIWYASDSRVSAKDGKLEFSEESKKSTTIITKMVAKKTGYHDELVRLEATMNLRSIPEGKTFASVLGLGSVEAKLGDPGNVEIRFTNNNGLKLSVVAYDQDGKETEVVAPQSIGAAANVTIKAVVSADGILNFSLNGKQLYNGQIPVSGEGRVGFLQDGSCAVSVSDVNIVAHRYDRPENCNIQEDFEKESININELTARMVYVSGHFVPYGMEIAEYDGNRVMDFKNMSLAYLGTMYQYSNFELTFDVLRLQRVEELDEEGNVCVPKNENIVVSFGDEATDYEDWGYELAPDAVVFDSSSRVYSMNQEHLTQAGQKGYDYASEDCDKDFTIRVSVIDGIVTVSMKWADENQFTEILKYKISDITPLGYVHIWAAGQYTNFSVDNLSIINKDNDPELVEVEFKSAVYDVPEDFVYEKIGYVYREKETEAEGTVSPYWMIPIVAVTCAAAFGIVFVVHKKKERRNHADAKN